MFELWLRPETYVSLASLVFLEIVLGIDNILFISIVAGRLPKEQRPKARFFGLLLAIVGRLALLLGIVWLSRLTEPFVTLWGQGISVRDVVMLLGGMFLIFKSAQEIYENVEQPESLKISEGVSGAVATFGKVIVQIVLIDIVFSLDSILTAVGMTSELPIMVVAVLVAVGIMMWASNPIGDFIDAHPSVKILGLSFLLMIGTLLVAEGFHYHVPKGYVYFSLAFSLFVEMANIRAARRRSVVEP